MTGNVAPYTNLIVAEHADKPIFSAIVAINCRPYADIIALLQSMPGLFDIDVAVGDQLDAVGEWVGLSRQLSIPLTGVYFAWDTAGLGWDQGAWQGPFDPTTGLVSLPDAQYRILLYARIASNHWNGTIPGAYAVLNKAFAAGTVFIQDNQDMSMYIGYVGPALDAITYALLTNGYLNIKPAGVRIAGYVTSTMAGSPVFGFDADNATIGGWDHGAWANITGGN